MTPGRVFIGVVAAWIALVVITAWGSMLAAVLGHIDESLALHHTSWMCVWSGLICAAAGLLMWMAWEFKNEVRGGAEAGSRPCPKGRVLVSLRSLKP